MSAVECSREQDVVAAVLAQRLEHSGPGEDRWRHASENDLVAHVVACEVCREAATVACLLNEEAIAARGDVQVPSVGQVWWRAAIRARVEAAHAVERPLTWLHGLAGACTAGAVVAVLGLAWPSIEGAVAWAVSRSWSAAPSTIETAELMMSILQRSLPLALLATLCAILAPIALYLTISDD